MPSSSASPGELLLRCHFIYEIKMMQETYRLCWEEVNNDASDQEKIINNALIESFCVHARNLIEFFQDKTFMRIYKNTSYDAFPDKNKLSAIYQRLCAQISHLVFKGKQHRTINAAQKIDAKDRYEILYIVGTEIAEFKKHLLPTYAHFADTIPIPPHPFAVPKGMGPSATTTTTHFAVAWGSLTRRNFP